MSAQPELIHDAEIDDPAQDRLGHVELTAELLQLITQTGTPANIALFGSWGSGKSGIGRLLRAQINNGYSKSMRFARFDAFKYAQNPLRRNFISVIASEIGVDDLAFGKDLYRSTTSTNVTFPAMQLLRLVSVLLAVVVAILLAVSLVVALWAHLSNQPVWPQLVRAASLAVPSSLVPASVVTAIVGLASKAFTSTHTSERAESDEEFELLFSKLVDKVGAKRKLVIFVDELDRCAPADVIETLDTIRTFFGVPGCVFIVAADQQVLEQAMTTKLRQATPLDAVNPYYSAGSSYLDKVFQYQLAVPPLQTKSITRFAAELVEDREGLWQRVNARAVASILVPAHVSSPRRVKHLLNSFVLAFRLAEARADAGQLDLDVAANAEALARVVCLQVEFPLFARDMVADPDLPSHVLGVHAALGEARKPETYWEGKPGVSDLVKKLAISYASDARPTATVVAADDETTEAKEVESAQTDQLIGYLERTNSIHGPYRDLLFLESSGAKTTLPTASAIELETAAQNGALTEVRRVLSGFDADQTTSALDFLTSGIRDAVGVEEPNFARAILATAELTEPDSAHAEAVLLEIEPTLLKYETVIDAETTAGAWALVAAAASERARGIATLIIQRDFVHDSNEMAIEALQHYDLLSEQPRVVASLVSDRILNADASSFLEMLLAIDGPVRLDVLRVSEQEIAKSLRAAFEAHDDWEAAEAPAATSRGAARTTTSAEPNPAPEPFDPAPSLATIATLGAKLDPSEKPTRELLVSMLLRVDRRDARDAVEALLGGLEDIRNPLAARVLRGMLPRKTSLWGRWTRPIDVADLTSDPAAREAIVRTARLMWTRLFQASDPDTLDEFEEGSAQVAHLLDDLSEVDRRSIGAEALPSTQIANDAATASALRQQLAALRSYRKAGLASDADIRRLQLESILGSLAEDIAAADIDEVDDAIHEALDDYLSRSEEVVAEELSDALQSISESIESATWGDEESHTDATAQILAASREFADSHPELHLDGAAMSGIIAERSPLPSKLLERWLAYTNLDAGEVLGVMKPILTGAPSAVVVAAFNVWIQRQPIGDRLGLAEQFVGPTVDTQWSDLVLKALHLGELEAQDLVTLLQTRYEAETTNDGRTYVLRVWTVAAPVGDGARRGLIDGVLVPMLQLNRGAADSALGLARQIAAPVPNGAKQSLRSAIIQASAFNGLSAKADRVLSELGLTPRPKPKLFGKRK